MYVIGHRGAAGLELENTATSLHRALSLGVDAIEIDVRTTKDRHVVLCHDADLTKIAGKDIKIEDSTLQELQAIKLNDGSRLITLEHALEIAKNVLLIIELKDGGYEQELLGILSRYPENNFVLASFNHPFLINLKQLNPNLKIFLAERTKPFEIVKFAREAQASGLDLNAWLLNPLTYWQARHYKLEIMVFTVNNLWVARFIHVFYPKVKICTDYPNRFIRRRKSRDTVTKEILS